MLKHNMLSKTFERDQATIVMYMTQAQQTEKDNALTQRPSSGHAGMYETFYQNPFNTFPSCPQHSQITTYEEKENIPPCHQVTLS